MVIEHEQPTAIPDAETSPTGDRGEDKIWKIRKVACLQSEKVSCVWWIGRESNVIASRKVCTGGRSGLVV